MRSLEFTVKHIMIKLFRTYDNVIIDCCMASFGLAAVSELVDKRIIAGSLINIGVLRPVFQ